MYEDETIDVLKNNLDALDKTTSWSVTLLFVIIITTLFTQDNIKILNIGIPKNISATVLFGILCGINFKVFHLLQNIRKILSILSPKTELATMRIRLHHWVLNPFSETDRKFSWFSDNFGYVLLLLFWWAGAQAGFFLIRTHANSTKVFIMSSFLFFVYLFLGIISMFLISDIINEVCQNKASIRIKYTFTIIAIPIGAFGLKYIFN